MALAEFAPQRQAFLPVLFAEDQLEALDVGTQKVGELLVAELDQPAREVQIALLVDGVERALSPASRAVVTVVHRIAKGDLVLGTRLPLAQTHAVVGVVEAQAAGVGVVQEALGVQKTQIREQGVDGDVVGALAPRLAEGPALPLSLQHDPLIPPLHLDAIHRLAVEGERTTLAQPVQALFQGTDRKGFDGVHPILPRDPRIGAAPERRLATDLDFVIGPTRSEAHRLGALAQAVDRSFTRVFDQRGAVEPGESVGQAVDGQAVGQKLHRAAQAPDALASFEPGVVAVGGCQLHPLDGLCLDVGEEPFGQRLGLFPRVPTADLMEIDEGAEKQRDDREDARGAGIHRPRRTRPAAATTRPHR